ncbi:UNVERIFIED_CONTAM: hypothetical protein FKN15_037985 [Acipenser sinensis]
MLARPAHRPLLARLSHTWRWEPLARQQAQALALAPAQQITPAPELTPPAPVVVSDVTEPDVSIAEEGHDAISITASWEGGSFLQKQPLTPLTIPLDQQLRNCCSILAKNARHLGRKPFSYPYSAVQSFMDPSSGRAVPRSPCRERGIADAKDHNVIQH